jgi:hypothetical protein
LFLTELRGRIKDHNDLVIIRQFCEPGILERLRAYVHRLGFSSLPSYCPLAEGCPDFHRIVHNDPRSYVKGTFHQYLFHPWNQNLFDLHRQFADIYHIKNLISGFPKDHFLGPPYTDFVSRIAIHHYPTGGGFLTAHADPVGNHQVVVPTLQLSVKGRDFERGGLFVLDAENRRTYVDDRTDIGDLVLFNASLVHGVEAVDEGAEPQWLDIRGRWMLLATTIKTAANATAANAREVVG